VITTAVAERARVKFIVINRVRMWQGNVRESLIVMKDNK
jgi:hypothetical protein